MSIFSTCQHSYQKADINIDDLPTWLLRREPRLGETWPQTFLILMDMKEKQPYWIQEKHQTHQWKTCWKKPQICNQGVDLVQGDLNFGLMKLSLHFSNTIPPLHLHSIIQVWLVARWERKEWTSYINVSILSKVSIIKAVLGSI